MANQSFQRKGVGQFQPFANLNPLTQFANRAPLTSDTGYEEGTMWIDQVALNIYINVLNDLGITNWKLLEAGGSSGNFSALTVNPGPTSLTGTTTVTGTLTSTGATTLATTGASASTFGNTTGTSSVGISVGSNGFTLTGATNSPVTIGTGITTGAFTIGAAQTTGTMNIGGTGVASGVMTIAGGTGNQAVNIAANATGNKTVTIGSSTGTSTTNILAGSGALNVTAAFSQFSGGLEAVGLLASGDGGGVASTTGFTNVSAPVAGGSGVFVINPTTGAGNTANYGFIKIYVGVTPYYIPIWAQTT